MSAGARLSRTVPPHVGGAVMTRDSVAGRVQTVDRDALRALVSFGDRSHWYDFSQLYDATRLVWLEVALELLDAGERLEYVIPGCAPFSVVSIVPPGPFVQPQVVLLGGGRVNVDPLAPRFRAVR